MKKNIFGFILTLVLSAGAVSSARAQEPAPTGNEKALQAVRPFKIMQELGLTRDQIRQIRRINQTRRPLMQEAQQRWQAARRSLDAAIYADDATEEQIRELTRAAQTAQAELLRERTLTEYLIRKVLTPDQLVKFRQLREQVRERLNELKTRSDAENPETEPQRPLNRFQQRRNRRRQP